MLTPQELARIEKIERTIGMQFIDGEFTPGLLKPENQLPGSGRYPVVIEGYQGRLQFDELLGEGGIIAQLWAALTARDTIIGNLAQQVQQLQQNQGGSTGGSVVGTILPLAAGDDVAEPMMRDTVSRMLVPSEVELDPVETLTGPLQLMGEVGIGGPPIRGVALALRSGGEIVHLRRVASPDTQEKDGDRDRCMVLSMNDYDNGFRMIRGGFYGEDGLLHRVQDVIDIFAMDSAGTVSKSTEDYSKPQVEKCQDYIIAMDWVKSEVVVTACRAGWGVRAAASSQSTNYLNDPNDGEPNFNRSVLLIEPLPGARKQP
jgi:hypothetical protein